MLSSLPTRLRSHERGATAVEYGLIAGLIALGIVGGLMGTRTSLNQDYGCIATSLGSSGGTPCASAAPVTPTTALGYAMQMVPSNRTVTGLTSNFSGKPYNFFCTQSGDSSKVGNTTTLCMTADPSYNPSYYFTGTTVAPYVYQISGYGGAPVNSQSGAVTYAIITPQGWITVETQPAQ